MSVYAIADLHLSHSTDKPMDIFGQKWQNHTQKIYENWQKTVAPGDTVIIPGDISWGMGNDDTAEDFLFLEKLNGNKIVGKGNHDYWWQTMRKLRAFTEDIGANSVSFLFNNAYLAGNIIVCGTRGWLLEGNYSEDDTKIVARECGRLELSIAEAEKLKALHPEAEITAFLHYPPAYNGLKCQPVIDVLNRHGIKRCYYGHIHGAPATSHEAYAGDTRLFCIAADFIGFTPVIVP